MIADCDVLHTIQYKVVVTTVVKIVKIVDV